MSHLSDEELKALDQWVDEDLPGSDKLRVRFDDHGNAMLFSSNVSTEKEGRIQARRIINSNSRRLDFSGLRLSKFPPIECLRNVENLNISQNRLVTLPENLIELAALHTLDVSSNDLTTLPDNIGNLSETVANPTQNLT